MATGDLRTVLQHLRRALPAPGGGGLTDGQLLGRFVAARDEAAFEALVYRHGPMVLGLCRRVLGNAHDAEDAFQATFLILARKAVSVVKRDSVGSWLFAVAQRTARQARAVLARRRARERQVDQMLHTFVAPAEPQDWHMILEREVARLPAKYREPVVLFHLEGWSHRETAQWLGVAEGTLSSRLLKARRLLAKRLSRYGLSLSFAGLTSVLSEGTAPAAVPAPLVVETVRAAALVAAGQLAAVTTPAALLTKGVLKTMLLTKLKLMVGMLLVVAVLGATGVAYRAGAQAPPTDKPRVEKPRSELEALRKENELLKLNLEVVLEKVRAQEAELRALRGAAADAKERNQAAERREELLRSRGVYRLQALEDLRDPKLLRFTVEQLRLYEEAKKQAPDAAVVKMVEDALKTLRAAKNAEEQQRAVEALEQALRKLKAEKKSSGEQSK